MVKAFWEEEGSDKVMKILEKFKEEEITIFMPSIAYYEIANAIRYNKELSDEEKKEAVESFYSLGIEKVDLALEEMKKCIEVAIQKDTTIYDTSYYIASRKLNAIYVTADEEFKEKIKDENVILLKNFDSDYRLYILEK